MIEPTGALPRLLTGTSLLREMLPTDHALVKNSWLKSYGYSHFNRRQCEGKAIFACHDPIIRSLLVNSRVKLVACDPAEPDNIQAWIVAGKRADDVPVVHYLWVREAFRGLGLEPRLFSIATDGALEVALTHRCIALDSNCGDARTFYDPHAVVTHF